MEELENRKPRKFGATYMTMNNPYFQDLNAELGEVVENGVVTARFPKYSEALAMADSEVNRIVSDGDNIDNSLRILQRQLNQYLRQ